MSAIPESNDPKRPKKKDLERIAKFMNGFLNLEMFDEIRYPEDQHCPYDDMSDEKKQQWYEYTFHEMFKDAAMQIAGLLGRQLSIVELNLIKRRIVDFFKRIGIDHENK